MNILRIVIEGTEGANPENGMNVSSITSKISPAIRPSTAHRDAMIKFLYSYGLLGVVSRGKRFVSYYFPTTGAIKRYNHYIKDQDAFTFE